MARAADQGFGGLDQRACYRAQPGEPVLADTNYRQPRLHDRSPATSALTAAAASALPPRRPLKAIYARPPEPISAALASAAPTNPTGKPRIKAGLAAPSASISSNRNSAVGALPIATTAASRWGHHRSTAAAERVVRRSAAIFATAGSRSVQMIRFRAGSRASMMPAASIAP